MGQTLVDKSKILLKKIHAASLAEREYLIAEYKPLHEALLYYERHVEGKELSEKQAISSRRILRKRVARSSAKERRAYRALTQLRTPLQELVKILPREFTTAFARFFDQINVAASHLVSELSRSGVLRTMTAEFNFDVHDLSTQLRATLQHVASLLASLEQLEQFIETQTDPILETIRKSITLEINLQPFYSGFGYGKGSLTLLDASFIIAILAARKEGIETITLQLGEGRRYVPNAVLQELKRARDHPQRLRLLRSLKFKGLKVPSDLLSNKEFERIIFDAWEFSFKGKFATELEVRKFKSTGDYELLILAISSAIKGRKVFILSNDSEIYEIVKILQKANVYPWAGLIHVLRYSPLQKTVRLAA